MCFDANKAIQKLEEFVPRLVEFGLVVLRRFLNVVHVF